ncbi:hypothetical protein HDU89_004740 [Geranomyces variabilis]|nr:hypothetical protein HDU89_004740 [Geranomyces variabilis]
MPLKATTFEEAVETVRGVDAALSTFTKDHLRSIVQYTGESYPLSASKDTLVDSIRRWKARKYKPKGGSSAGGGAAAAIVAPAVAAGLPSAWPPGMHTMGMAYGGYGQIKHESAEEAPYYAVQGSPVPTAASAPSSRPVPVTLAEAISAVQGIDAGLDNMNKNQLFPLAQHTGELLPISSSKAVLIDAIRRWKKRGFRPKGAGGSGGGRSAGSLSKADATGVKRKAPDESVAPLAKKAALRKPATVAAPKPKKESVSGTKKKGPIAVKPLTRPPHPHVHVTINVASPVPSARTKQTARKSS